LGRRVNRNPCLGRGALTGEVEPHQLGDRRFERGVLEFDRGVGDGREAPKSRGASVAERGIASDRKSRPSIDQNIFRTLIRNGEPCANDWLEAENRDDVLPIARRLRLVQYVPGASLTSGRGSPSVEAFDSWVAGAG